MAIKLGNSDSGFIDLQPADYSKRISEAFLSHYLVYIGRRSTVYTTVYGMTINPRPEGMQATDH